MAKTGSPRLTAQESATRLEKDELKDHPRAYQLEMLELALQENTIVNLGTGSGKTFIAVMLIRELQHEIYGPWNEKKRTVFLVPSVPLVDQQAKYVKDHLSLNVGMYKGDMNVDSWDIRRWIEEFEKHHVLVMTHQILLNILNHFPKEIPLSKLNLLIFDECHHCNKNHPYREIMRHFEKDQRGGLPRVLGLTASLIKAKVKPHKLKESVHKLESMMRSRCQTAADIIQVGHFAARAEVSTHQYTSSVGVHLEELWRIVAIPLAVLQNYSRQQKEECTERVYSDCKRSLEDVQYTLVSLGAPSALIVAEECWKKMNTNYQMHGYGHGVKAKRLVEVVLSSLSALLRTLRTLSPEEVKITSKVNLLLRILGDYGIQNGETTVGKANKSASRKSEKLCGIVFAQRRSTAQRLCDLLLRLAESQPELRYVRCDYLVGHSSTGGAGRDSMTASKQEDVLRRFRKKRINLLIATSVVEEGLDVPHCNLIIRFDLPNDVCSYIQSKGRARAQGSRYIMMVANDKNSEQLRTLEYYRDIEAALEELVRQSRFVPSRAELERAAKEQVPPYRPEGVAGSQATLSSSLSLIHMYCQKLPRDGYTNPQPRFTIRKVPRPNPDPLDLEEDHTPVYICSISLPLPCPYRLPIEGQEMESPRLAEKAAALKAVEVLHKHGLLNNHLLPVLPTVKVKEEIVEAEAEQKGTAKEKEDVGTQEKHAGTDKRREHYQRHVPQELSGCYPTAGERCCLYSFHIKDAKGCYYQGKDGEVVQSFGVLSSKKLPVHLIPTFSLYVRETEFTVTVEEVEQAQAPVFTQRELQLLARSHAGIMEGILRDFTTDLEFSPGESPTNYLIVPVSIIPKLHTCYVDTKVAGLLARTGKEGSSASSMALGNAYEDKIVTKAYDVADKNDLFAVVRVDLNTRPSSRFPHATSDEFSSYAQYFQVKYGAVMTDPSQPALVCQTLSSRTDLLTSRFKTRKRGEAPSGGGRGAVRDGRTILLFPELCFVHLLPASLYRLLHCLPAALWRLESALAANQLRLRIQAATEVGVVHQRVATEVMSDCSLQDLSSGGRGLSSLDCSLVYGDGAVVPLDHCSSLVDNGIETVIGPSNAVLLQALTLSSAEDMVDLERLEILGDTFLKLGTSVSLFCAQEITSTEGHLTEIKSNIVSNLNLYSLARARGLPSFIIAKSLRSLELWQPPCYVLASCDSHVTSKYSSCISDKGVADCVESLIGAYLSCGGMAAALNLMLWLGISLNVRPRKKMKAGLPHQNCNNNARDFFTLVTTPSGILQDFFTKWEFQSPLSVELARLAVGLDMLEDRIKYRFQDRRYLVEACTHASYERNCSTNCYQKLEFLGDAVLDYLITTFIYQRCPAHSPGDLTQLRSALVNNNTFAEMSLELGLHRMLKHNSPRLFADIDRYVKSREDSRADMDRHCEAPLPGYAKADVLEGLSELSDLDREEQEEEQSSDVCTPKVLGDLIESLAGAVFMDSGMDLGRVWAVFERYFLPLIDQYSKHLPPNPIDELLRIHPTAKFHTVSRTPRECFVVTVNVDQPSRVAYGNGPTEAVAKRNAASRLIRNLQAESSNRLK